MKKIGLGLIITGILMLLFYFVYNVSLNKKYQDDMNNYINETSQIVEEEEENIIEESQAKKNKSNSNISYTAILEIPKINLKRGVVNNTKNFRSINYAISVDNNSKYPNENGNFILYSHSGNSSIAFFNKLYKVDKNDDIYVYYNGIKYHYKVVKKYEIEKTGKAKVINSKSDKYITLITCNQNNKDFQIVLVGKQISNSSY